MKYVLTMVMTVVVMMACSNSAEARSSADMHKYRKNGSLHQKYYKENMQQKRAVATRASSKPMVTPRGERPDAPQMKRGERPDAPQMKRGERPQMQRGPHGPQMQRGPHGPKHGPQMQRGNRGPQMQRGNRGPQMQRPIILPQIFQRWRAFTAPC